MGERTDEVTLAPETDETAAIRADIENTRADMSETIDALQDRLSPERVAEQIKDKVREQAADAYSSARATAKDKAERIVSNMSSSLREAGSTAGTFATDVGSSLMDTRAAQTVRQNPIPFALIGAGITMLLMNRRKQSATRLQTESREPYRGYYENRRESYQSPEGIGGATTTEGATTAASNMASRAGDRMSSAAQTLADKASAARNQTREGLSAASERMRQTSTRASGALQSALRENPLAVGVAAVAVGSVVGLALPVTRTEQQYLGETRDQLLDNASTMARDTIQKVQRAAEDAGRTVQEQVQQHLSS